ncbi:sialidase family protein [Actinomadura parmotrematis]|uniref:Exo-alpha-sialidase n=1 Tax=Actinomadura parmotrematis TaxID=2864039 RepID=A0ABS7FV58_9ACTN|nr:hypothetical protein [Actinomadura parmotrematis]MBW8484312.1 hypothetical protein [Actinomadura parmotrematis]
MTSRSPEQDGALAEGGTAGSRATRLRLASGPPARIEGTPWWHAQKVWRDAGIAWSGAPGPVDDDIPPVPAAPGRARRPGPLAAAAVALGVAAAGGYALTRGHEDAGRAAPAPVPADALFASDPAAASDGLGQVLGPVAAAGAAVVAAGAETESDGRDRAQFLVSSGGPWRLAGVRAASGAEPVPGARPALLAARPGGWAALGRDPAGATVTWTSRDAATWTEAPGGAAFAPADAVAGLAGTAAGFTAVGASAGRAAVWASPDGRSWRRAAPPAGATVLDRIAASGGILVAHGAYPRTVKQKGAHGKRKTVTTSAPGLWRSADGGASWTRIEAAGGPALGLAAGPGGLYLVRGGKGGATVLTSTDGRSWRIAVRLSVPGYGGVAAFAGSAAGLAALLRGAGGTMTLLTSTDGRAWRPAAGYGGPAAAPDVRGLAVGAAGTPVLAGRLGDDPYLSAGAPVDLAAVPGAIRPDRAVTALAVAAGRTVAVGGANGGPAAWEGGGLAWTRAAGTAAPGETRLTGVAGGPAGWVAVGARGTLLTSPDAASWTRAPAPGGVPAAVAYGPRGYVAAGTALWRSADLRTWTRGTAPAARLRAVTATPGGYVAVGGATAPAVLTSADGATWTAAPAPAPPPGVASAVLTRVVASGARVLAVGEGRAKDGPAAFLALSADGGATWTARPVPGGAVPSAVTATPGGFALAAPGAPAPQLYESADGAAWRRVPVRGAGSGEQRITALAPAGGALLGAGTVADHRGSRLVLWRTMAP